MADDQQLTPLQLGQALTLMSQSIRELTTQMIELRTKFDLLAHSFEVDRQSLSKFANEVKTVLREAASSDSQEMRVARIDTPLPPPLTRHGRTRP
jgi:phosphoenolpyruvate carboxylase